jgi:hypothetical protein
MDDKEELLRLREENLRLRAESLRKATHLSSTKTDAQIINVKQVNESALSGCAGVIGMIFLLGFLVSQCSG